jgi:subtilase family serine protease
MRPIQKITSAVAAAILVAGGLAVAAAPAQAKPLGFKQMNSCGASAARGFARCMAVVRTTVTGLRASGTVHAAAATPSGLSPASLQSAYKLPSSSAGSGKTIAIVDAYDDPNAEADLGVYRSYYGLSACTTANGCFKKVSQTGSTTSLPSKDGGWAEEISLDIDMVSAICPNCKILLVEARSASFANLGAAVNEAAALGANAISNSYGGSDAADSTYGAYYNHPGIAVTASSGDSGYGASYPASSHYVTAVGGTTLKTSSTTRGWTETAWADAGSGCSAYNTALTGQASFSTGCSRRAEADVSAVADPATGVSVYDSYAYQGYSGWLTFGGTSASSPIIASVYGLAGNTASIDNNYPYTHSTGLFDVTSGSNGTCSTSQWCNARAGWDGPTGLGTPNGVSAF